MAQYGGSDNGGMFAYDHEGQRAGNDLWYQIPRFYCQLCGIFMDNNKPTKEHHFSGYRHRMNKEAKIREIQKAQKEKAEIEELKADTIKLIEQKGKEAYRKDCGLAPSNESDMVTELAAWQEVSTPKGEVYYWHEKSNKTQWEKPPGWEKYRKAREKYLEDKRLEKIKARQVHSAAARENALLQAKLGAKAVGVGGAIAQANTTGVGLPVRMTKRTAEHLAAKPGEDGPSLGDLKRQKAAYGDKEFEVPAGPSAPDEIPDEKVEKDLSKNSSSRDISKFYPMPVKNERTSSRKLPKFDGTDGDLG